MGFEEALEKVLEMKKYDVLTGRRPNLGELLRELLGQLFRALWEWLVKHLHIAPMEPAADHTAFLAKLFLLLGAVGLSIALTLVFFRLRRRKSAPAPEDAPLPALPEEDLLCRREAFLRAGDTRQAARCDYLALLLALTAKGLIPKDPAKTGVQLARELTRRAPGFEAAFARAQTGFNAAWFGQKPLADYSGWAREMASFRREVARYEA